MYRVLLPVDTNESRARAQADYVAELPEAETAVEAIVLHVFTEDEASEPRDVTRVGSVRRARERLDDAGVEVTLLEDSLDAVDNILAYADEYDVASIVLGGRKRSPAGKAMFGSVTQSVIYDTDRPVVVTGGGD
jgi:nucleotide-binding universal stress UspA family protein